MEQQLAGMLAIFGIVFGGIALFMIVTFWKIYKKAGQEGWACLIPIYNVITLLKIVGKPWWWFFLMCIPLVNVVILIIVYHNLSVSFGKEAGFTCGLIFLGIIFFPILAFSDAKYVGPGGVAAPAPIAA